MTWSEELEKHWQELEREIKAKQPVVDESERLKKEQELIGKILELHGGRAPASAHQAPAESTMKWKALCDDHGWRVGGDSAHRVVRRNDPALHASIKHKCVYDGRDYP